MTKNILLVEYDESTINVIKELFQPPLFEIAVASEGEMAKRLLNSRPFDLMITAAMLPRFHGFNLALAVAQDHPGIKIIIISAIYKGVEYKHQAITQYRADDFFEKPLEKEKFKNRVLDLLNLSASDLGTITSAASTQIPVFDTAKIPAPKFADDESGKLSSADIFGDIIQKIEKVPEFKIDLGGEQPAPNIQPKKEEPRHADPAQTVLLKKEPEVVPEIKKPDPGTTLIATPPGDTGRVQESRKAAASAQSINDSLDSLRHTVKKSMPENKMRKIEDDIARRFEDTLSGLGLKPKRPAAPPSSPGEPQVKPSEKAAPKPEAKLEPESAPAALEKIIVKEEEKLLEDEIIELGEESLQKDKEPEPDAKDKKSAASKETKLAEKAVPQDNPNEVGDYVLLGLIARGGMAEIYKAKKKGVKGFEKVIAIKKILSGYGEDDKFIEMLVDEAKIAAELSHPNIIQIYDLGRKDNYYFIAMEYVLGKDLREIQTRLRERDSWFPEEISLYLTIKILEALNYAHKAKDSRGRPLEIVHRDVSPPNILISYSGDVKLTDFGVSKATIKIHQTLSGALKGKLLYMSPEQARGESDIDFRSDLYSAGVVLFELLTGKKLFLDTTEMMVLKKVQNGEILNPREINPDIDPALEKIILTSLNKDREKRYQNAATMTADLEVFIHKKYDHISGPVHLSHFIYGLFETDIQREGIKVDLKPLPPKPRPREIPKPPPPEKPQPAVAVPPPPLEKPQPVVAVPPPPPPAKPSEPEGLVRISFDEDKIAVTEKKPDFGAKAVFRPDSIFKELDREKKKFPAWVAALSLFIVAAAAGLYFFVFNKPETPIIPVDSKPAEEMKAAASTQLTGQEKMSGMQPEALGKTAPIAGAVPDATQKMLDDAKLKQEEDLKKLKEEEDKKKLQEEKRKKQAEIDRLKKEEADRIKQEEQARLLQEEADRIKQEEQARLKKEEADRKKAEELKRLEQARVKEGDIIPLNDADVQPVAISTPSPNIPSTILSSMPNSQTLMFTVLINQNGDVETVRILQKSNNSQLNTILTDLIKTWKYSPAQKNSVRVKVWKTIPLTIKK
ncbi:MAG: protein kinase [Acidobacteria bacterium]|nr:protein kinase [Acidobacteriota bacterium]MBU4307171.1 protein kinase [Acidobacteriota bacterium]MBU4405265.1 protein kinase [Acidobacteriota bacterium]MCG2810935.1 protein kinase [Candidatus Aminicenantes bacterium]